MEIGAGRGATEGKSHIHVCCFIEIGEEVEACESVFYCIFADFLEDESMVV